MSYSTQFFLLHIGFRNLQLIFFLEISKTGEYVVLKPSDKKKQYVISCLICNLPNAIVLEQAVLIVHSVHHPLDGGEEVA